MINLSIILGKPSTSLKLAPIAPIFKLGDPYVPQNYRPISILPFLGNFFERCIYNRLYDFSIKFSLFTSKQFGFLRNKSTSLAIANLTEYLYDVLDSRDISCNIFIDLRKAFDTIPHRILLNKLELYGIRGLPLDLLTDYLTDRLHCVRIGNTTSSPRPINIGVPQGSILGPLLFILYINDLPNISNLFHPTIFADDTTISIRDSSPTELVLKCNDVLEKLHDWTTCNRLSINYEKTFYMLTTNQTFTEPFGNISINGHELDFRSEGKFLGIIFDNKLKFNHHTKYICNKISKSIGIIHRLKAFLPTRCLFSLYHSFIYPYLTY